MFKETTNEHEALKQKVKESLHKAEKTTSGLQQTNTRLLVIGIASSASATLVAGVTAAVDPLVGEGIAGWRLACIVAAVFGFLSTLSTGMNQQLKLSARLSKGRQCVGKLRALDLMVTTGQQGRKKIIREYEEILKTYPDFIR